MNVYFICVIVCVQMWYVYTQSLDDQTQFFFLSILYVFESVFV